MVQREISRDERENSKGNRENGNPLRESERKKLHLCFSDLYYNPMKR